MAPTLESVRAQTFGDWELIVVDDGSTDGTPEEVEASYPRALVVRQANAGPGAARNAGAAVASGRYLAFLDSDDLWLPWTLETVAGLVRSRADIAMVGLAATTFENETELDGVQRGEGEPEVFVARDLLDQESRIGWMGSSVPMFRRVDYLEVGGYPDRRMNQEDVDLWLRMGTRERFAYIASPVLYARRVHGENVSWNRELDWIGTRNLIEGEKRGRYPGGDERRGERGRILTAALRAASIRCLRGGEWRRAWHVYRRSLGWNLRQGRWRYVLGFPCKAVASVGRKDARRLGGRVGV